MTADKNVGKAENFIVFWGGTAYPVPYPIESDVDIAELDSIVIITYRTASLAANIFEFEDDAASSEALRLLTQRIDDEGEPVSMSDIAALQGIAVACRNTRIDMHPIVYLKRDRGAWRVSRTMPEAIWTLPCSPRDNSTDAVERAAERDANERGEFIVQVVYRHRRASDCIVRKTK